MGSPFPGMDPYLEQYWRDVHHSLITYARDQVQPRLPGQLRARVEERVFLESETGERRIVYPDFHVIEYPKPRPQAPLAEGGVAVAEPSLLLHFKREPVTQGYIEIIDSGSGNRVVTVVEFVSPSNKTPGEGQRLYEKKKEEVRAAGANMVEIDLTRGETMVTVSPDQIPEDRRAPYMVCVQRGYKPDYAEVYLMPLQQRLPAIPVPLRQTDKDVPLDLQALIEQCYENGRYDDLNYRVEPVPPLTPADTAWADELLRSKGAR